MLSENFPLEVQSAKNEFSNKLDMHIQLTLHTKIAERLFNGSWKEGRIGLRQFAQVVGMLWKAVKLNDPYAEWYLLKTYQALFDARERFKIMESTLSSALNSLRGVAIHSPLTGHPVSFNLNFSTPFGFMGAYLIADMDHILRQLLTLEKMGVVIPQNEISIKSVVKSVHEVFSVPRKWRNLNITRQDVEGNNERAKAAKDLFGELPEAVLKKSIEFAFLPKTDSKKT